MRFLDTDTGADVIALLNRMWGAASDDFKVQQWVTFDGLCAKKNPRRTLLSSVWKGLVPPVEPVQTALPLHRYTWYRRHFCSNEFSKTVEMGWGGGWQKTKTTQQSRTYNWRWSVRHVKDRADTDILPGVTLDLYPFTWTSTENWSWRSARRSGSARNRSGCPSSSPVCHPRRWHPGRTLTDLHLHRPLHRHPAAVGGVVCLYICIF